MISLLLDTNVLLHYRPLVEVDWQAVAGSKLVQIVLVMPVIHELDEKKSHPVLGDRAKRAIREIAEIRKHSGIIRPSVTLQINTTEVDPLEIRPPFAIERRDDQILWIARSLASKGVQIRVVSEDLGMQVKCETHSIRCVAPPEPDRLADPAAEKTRELRAVQKELDRLKNRKPVLAVALSRAEVDTPGNRLLEVVIPPPTRVDRDSLMCELRTEYSYYKERTSPGAMIGVPLFDYLKPSIKEYNALLDQYFEQHNRYLCTLQDFHENRRWLFGISVWVMNEGTLPTDQIDLELRAPVTSMRFLGTMDDCREPHLTPPKPPEPPPQPRPRIDAIALGQLDRTVLSSSSLSKLLHTSQSLADQLNRNVTGVRVEKGGSIIKARIKQLRHHEAECVGAFLARIDRKNPPRAAKMTYTIRDSANIDSTEGECVIKVGIATGD